jgi:hypothetical protein
MIACGNGRGGGDFWGYGLEFVGAWAGNRIGIVDKPPMGYAEIAPDFVESDEIRRRSLGLKQD